MKFVQMVYRGIIDMRTRYLRRIVYKGEMRNINRKEFLWSGVELTPDQEQETKDYWKEISGFDIDTRWHRLYQSYMGIYNKQYFPEILYSTKLEPLLSPAKYHGILSDKGLITSIFPGECGKYRLPETYIYNCAGVFTDASHSVISKQEAHSRIANCGSAIIKPTVDTSSGEGVRLLAMKDGRDDRTGETAQQIMNSYGSNYIVQECISQSPYLSKIYSGSLNTFRVITYICDGQVYVAPIAMRIGSNGSYLDNLHAGGMGVGVRSGNTLREFAFTEMGKRYEKHPDSGISFDGYVIPPIDDIRKAATELHGRIPQIQMVSWDWSLDENDIPVLIEVNISGQAVWFPQMMNGEAVFGEHTEYFANMIREK